MKCKASPNCGAKAVVSVRGLGLCLGHAPGGRIKHFAESHRGTSNEEDRVEVYAEEFDRQVPKTWSQTVDKLQEEFPPEPELIADETPSAPNPLTPVQRKSIDWSIAKLFELRGEPVPASADTKLALWSSKARETPVMRLDWLSMLEAAKAIGWLSRSIVKLRPDIYGVSSDVSRRSFHDKKPVEADRLTNERMRTNLSQIRENLRA